MTHEREVKVTRHANGTVATRVVRYQRDGQEERETMRVYSSSGVYYNFFDGPAGSFTN